MKLIRRKFLKDLIDIANWLMKLYVIKLAVKEKGDCMKRLNDFLSTKQRKTIKNKISLCGKLEALIGNYYLYGAGINDIQVLYYDSTVGFYDSIPLKKENIVAYILEDENIAFVRDDMVTKLKKIQRNMS